MCDLWYVLIGKSIYNSSMFVYIQNIEHLKDSSGVRVTSQPTRNFSIFSYESKSVQFQIFRIEGLTLGLFNTIKSLLPRVSKSSSSVPIKDRVVVLYSCLGSPLEACTSQDVTSFIFPEGVRDTFWSYRVTGR